jgi:hypothetical protein
MKHADMGMIQGGDCTGFLLEAPEAFRISGNVSPKDFDGYIAPQARIPRAIDLPHSPRTHWGKDLIRAEASAGRERHGFARRIASLYGSWAIGQVSAHCDIA